MTVIEGTSEGDHKKEPGDYNACSGRRASLPGLGGVMASSTRGEWRILGHPFEKLVLTACHSLYSASHRFVVYARLKSQAYRHAA